MYTDEVERWYRIKNPRSILLIIMCLSAIIMNTYLKLKKKLKTKMTCICKLIQLSWGFRINYLMLNI